MESRHAGINNSQNGEEGEDGFSVDKFLKVGNATTDCRTENSSNYQSPINIPRRKRARSSILWINSDIEHSGSNSSLSSTQDYIDSYLEKISKTDSHRHSRCKEILTFAVGFTILIIALCLFINIAIDVTNTLNPYIGHTDKTKSTDKNVDPSEGFT